LKVAIIVVSIFSIVLILSGYFFFSGKTKDLFSDCDYLAIAKIFQQKGFEKEAIENFKNALKRNPDNMHANVFLAKYFYKTGQCDESIRCYEKLLLLQPNNPSLYFNLGYLLFSQKGEVKKAKKFFKKAFTLDPTNINNRKMLRECYLKLGKFKKANIHMKCIEDCYIEKGITRKIDDLWNGADLVGKTILLRDNLGIGDAFCWIRYAKNFKEQGAKVVLELRNYLIPLLSSYQYVDQIIAKGSMPPNFDFQFLIGVSPYMMHKDIESVRKTSESVPYLFVDVNLVEKWKKILSKDKNFKIGICWESKTYKGKISLKKMENKRSMPLYYFYPLSKLKNVSLYSLQQVDGLDQLDDIPKDFNIHIFDSDFDKTYGSFTDTAAVMKNLDLVVTVDTSVAHLAGALGVPVWVMLPFVPDWRWFDGKGKSAWYPTMYLFRQQKPGDWESVMRKVVGEVRRLAG